MRIRQITQDTRKGNLSNIPVASSLFHMILNRNETSLGNLMQRLAYADDELIVSLSNSLKMHDYEVKQRKTLWGRFVTLFTTVKDPEWFEVDGTRLLQIFQLADVEPPVKLSASMTYSIETTELRTMLQKVSA